MINKTGLYTFLLCLSCLNYIKSQPIEKPFEFILKWTPSKLIEPQHSTIFLNAELVWKKKLGFSLGYGQKCYVWDKNSFVFNDYYKSNIELTYQFFHLEPVSFFAGINAFHHELNYAKNSGYVYLNDTFYSYEYAEHQFIINGLYGLGGMRITEGHFMMEFYSGLGFRQRNVSVSNIEGQMYHDGFFEWIGPGRETYPGTDYTWHFSLGMRIGVVF